MNSLLRANTNPRGNWARSGGRNKWEQHVVYALRRPSPLGKILNSRLRLSWFHCPKSQRQQFSCHGYICRLPQGNLQNHLPLYPFTQSTQAIHFLNNSISSTQKHEILYWALEFPYCLWSWCEGSVKLFFKKVGQVILGWHLVGSIRTPMPPQAGQDGSSAGATPLWPSVIPQDSVEESGLFSEAYQASVSARVVKNSTLTNCLWDRFLFWAKKILKTPGVHEEASLFSLGTQGISLYVLSTLSSNSSAAFHWSCYEENMPTLGEMPQQQTERLTKQQLSTTVSRMTAGKKRTEQKCFRWYSLDKLLSWQFFLNIFTSVWCFNII